MELLYLWIEDYKNIKKQGFNFSPRFDVKYDEKENLLTINEKKNYTSIFPNNINITAIVGENGSGKSSFLEVIKQLDISTNTYISVPYIKVFMKNNKLILTGSIFDTKNNMNLEYLYIPMLPSTNKKHNEQKLVLKKEVYSNIHLYQYSFDVDKKSIVDYPNKKLSIEYIAIEDKKMLIEYIRNNEEHKKRFGEYFEPNQCEIRLNENISGNINSLVEKYKQLPKRDDEHPFIWRICQYIMIILESTGLNNPLTGLDNINDLKKYIRKFLKNKDERNISKIQEIKTLVEYIKKLTNLGVNIKSENEFHSIFTIETTLLLENFFILKNLPDCFVVDFLDKEKNIRYNDLSSGEKTILKIRFFVENTIQNSNANQHIFLLDEIETDLHPNWQKKLLNYLIETFSKREQQYFHFILTTHSPFLLSDIPKENAIFLEKGKQIYPDIETFGANIHTLLSHGFFMKDGLMGEFAKSKIDKAIKYLNQTVLSSAEMDFCENIIFIVGEPILKRQLQKMIDSKKMDSVATDIKDEIKLLKHRIALLSQRL